MVSVVDAWLERVDMAVRRKSATSAVFSTPVGSLLSLDATLKSLAFSEEHYQPISAFLDSATSSIPVSAP
jgi:hypothetical protein